MADFDLFESLVTAESEDRVRRATNERALKEAAFDVRRQFGAYLSNAQSTMDYNERFSFVENNIRSVLADTHVESTLPVLSWLKQEFFPEHLNTAEKTKVGKLARRGDNRSAPKTAKGNTKQAKDPRTVVGGIDWQWDNESNSFKSTKSSNFQCVCGSAVAGVGQHECHCGRLWNLSSIVDGNKTAAPPTFVCREVMRRDVHLAKKADIIDPKNPHKHNKDDEWEWSDGYDVKNLIGPAAGEGTHDAHKCGCCANCTGDDCGCCSDCSSSSGDSMHDVHVSALDMIFAADDDVNSTDDSAGVDSPSAGSENDSAGNESATPGSAFTAADEEFMPPQQTAPIPPPAPAGPSMMNGDPAGMEDQPAEDIDISQAQQLILDMILREKAEEVVNEESNHDEIQQLNDAYQSLDVVKDLENAEMMESMTPGGGIPAQQLATYQAGAKYGYVLGYLEALADSSYDNRKTDFEGFQPPIPGLSPGMDDADPTPGKDTTDELRQLLKTQFDDDNAANKDQKPLDPAKPFGPDHGKSSRFKVS